MEAAFPLSTPAIDAFPWILNFTRLSATGQGLPSLSSMPAAVLICLLATGLPFLYCYISRHFGLQFSFGVDVQPLRAA
jgi:hypothetical protein